MSKRGAKPIPAAEPVAPALDGELLAQRDQQLAVMNQHQQSVIEQYGDGLPWSPEHYEVEIRRELRAGFESLLRAGRYLCVAREFAVHGEWNAMLGRLGISTSQAQRMMEAARRTPNVPALGHLGERLGSTKFFDLLALPDDELQALTGGGSIDGLGDVDDLVGMTSRDLKAALRELRTDIETKESRAADREREIDRLQSEVSRLKRERAKATPNDVAKALREAAMVAAMQVRADIAADGYGVMSLHAAIKELRQDAAAGEEGEHDQFLGGLIGDVMAELRRVRDMYDLPIVNDHGA